MNRNTKFTALYLKRQDWLRWVQAMSNIQQRAEEIILTELIYV